MSKLLAGIDVGTTGVRCMLFDTHGKLVSGTYQEYETKYLRPGWAEQDLEQMISQTMYHAKIFYACFNSKPLINSLY